MNTARACAISCVFAMSTGQAFASGFGLREGDADWMANAFAGTAAKAYNASTAYSNPAGMVRLDRSEITAGGSYIAPSLKFNGTNTIGGRPTRGDNGGNLIEDAATFSGYGVWSYAPDLKFGVAVSEPFGQRVHNPSTFVGRYQSLVSSISDINVSLSAAYAFNEHLSIGGGPVIDHFEARLTQAINVGPLNAIAGDPVGDLHGHDTSAGFDVGALYQFTPDLRVGLNYRSSVVHSITGTQGVYTPPLIGALSPATARLLASQVSKAKTKITLPDTVTLGGYWQVSPRWAVMTDLQFTHWSLLDKVAVTPQTPGVAGTTITENFRDTYSAAFGASYKATDRLLLQTGFLIDQTPTTNSNRTTRIPDWDRYLISLGATIAVIPNLDVSLAYAHVIEQTVKINGSAQPAAGVITGKYTDSADTFAIGATYKF